jgi:hypothetical protein
MEVVCTSETSVGLHSITSQKALIYTRCRKNLKLHTFTIVSKNRHFFAPLGILHTHVYDCFIFVAKAHENNTNWHGLKIRFTRTDV